MCKAQLEAQSATSATFAIAEVVLHFNFLFWNIAEVALRAKIFKICCALIALRFQIFFFFFFWLKAQFYALNLILFHFDRNIDKCRPSLADYLLFSDKNLVMEFSRPVSGLETVSRHIFESLVSVSPRTWTSSLDLKSRSRKVMVLKYEKSRDSKSWLGVGVKFWI